MAVDSPKPASRGRTSRLKVAGRLTGLIGLPLLMIFLIFASGVYCGASRSYRVRTLEAKWLGFEPPPGAGGAGDEPATERSAPGPSDAPSTDEGGPDIDADESQADTEGAPTPVADPADAPETPDAEAPRPHTPTPHPPGR